MIHATPPLRSRATDPTRGWSARLSLALVVALVTVLLSVTGPSSAVAAATSLTGRVESGGISLGGYEVTLYQTIPGSGPQLLGTAESAADGTFSIPHDATSDPSRIFYVVARSDDLRSDPDVVTLAAVLGPEVGTTVVVNPRTTVATAYAMAQFLDRGAISGPSPGVPNAASMAANVADPTTGAIGAVFAGSANDGTEARPTFNSLANVVAACVANDADCEALRVATTPAGRAKPADSLQALVNLARDPSHGAAAVDSIATSGPMPYGPARTTPAVAWTIALRFAGDGQSLDGPGNFVVDHEGNVWVANNYSYVAPGDTTGACGSDQVMKFAPDGQYLAGSPYSGGGLSGVGYGIARDRYGDIWLSNFGFASLECPDQPFHNSLSRFSADGTAISPPRSGDTAETAGGYIVGGIDWPQGMEFDDDGDLWIANCNGNSVTMVPDGDPARAVELDDIGVTKPFDVAFGADGNTYVTGTASDNVAILGPDGTPLADSPLTGFKRPMGITSTSNGELWVANSGLIDLPCPDKDVTADPPPSVSHIDPATHAVTTFSGGGLLIPWGISVDGHDNIWVSNFGGKRVSAFCGRDDSPYCPEGVDKGDSLSPDGAGYTFDGLTRSTAVQADTAGNLWVTNNWMEQPVETNPGGYHVVVYLGIAGPIQPPPPEPKPTPPPPGPTPTTPTPPVAPPAGPIPTRARFTG